MKIRWLLFVVFLSLTAALLAAPGEAQEPTGDPKDKAAIAKNAEAFTEAFHKADARTLAAFWAPSGEYTDQTGKQLKGREAIEKAFKEFFANNKGLKVQII